MSDPGGAEKELGRWPPKFVLAVSLGVLSLMPAVTMAGSGGMALLMFILGCLGVLGLIAHKAWKGPFPLWLISLAVFLSWAWMTQFWSSYPKTSGFSNAEKILVMGLVFPAVIWLWAQMRDHVLGGILRKAVIFIMSLSIILLTIDAFSGFRISFLFDPMVDGESYARRHADSVRNIGRGLVFCSVLVIPMAAFLWDSQKGKALSLLLMAMISTSAWKVGVNIAVISPWLALGAGLLAMRAPEISAKILIILSAIAILAAPIFASLITLIDKETISNLPGSWEHRLYMWEYVFHQIAQAPWIGHGFDSSRAFTETITLSGEQTVSLISLHTHNGGLQIWLETGLIGALLAGVSIIFLIQPASDFARQGKYHAFGLCGFVFAMTLTASLSFGVWQFWWWATLSFGLACLNLVRLSTLRQSTHPS